MLSGELFSTPGFALVKSTHGNTRWVGSAVAQTFVSGVVGRWTKIKDAGWLRTIVRVAQNLAKSTDFSRLHRFLVACLICHASLHNLVFL